MNSILIVDDTVDTIHTLREMLRSDYKIHFATNGSSALTLATTLLPDLILLDIIMPNMGGYEVCVLLKENPLTRDIPVIFISAINQEENEAMAFSVGGADYITKPFRSAVVKNRIKNHLALQNANRKLTEQNAILIQTLHRQDEMERMTNQDTKGPLSRIIETSEQLLAQAALNHGEEDMVHSIHGAALLLLEMTNTSLDLDKIERGVYTLNPCKVDLLAVLGRLLEEQESLWRSKHLLIQLLDERGQAASFGTFHVMGEALLLHSLFGNLLIYAMESATLGSTIILTLMKTEEFVTISIHWASRFSAEARERFFEKKNYPGKKRLGTGGYLSHLMAELHGGGITLESSGAEGSLFQVTLPWNDDSASEAGQNFHLPSHPVVEIPLRSSSTPTSGQEEAKILVVDDQMENIFLLQKALGRIGTLYFATSGEQAVQVAIAQMPDLILLDVMMPGMDGYATLVQLRQERVTRDIPVVFVTAMDHQEGEEMGLKLGAIDYIAKPFHAQSVRLKVHNILELKKLRDFYARLSLLDGLTGISNRRRFDEALELEWRRGLRSGKPLSLLILDVDFFKLYNDHYGHIAGDECLRRLAKTIAICMDRAGDIVARYGGEEFVCLLPETNESGAATIGQKIQQMVAELAIPHALSPVTEQVTLSLGGATALPQQDVAAITLLSLADTNLYRAKNNGRNQFVQ